MGTSNSLVNKNKPINLRTSIMEDARLFENLISFKTSSSRKLINHEEVSLKTTFKEINHSSYFFKLGLDNNNSSKIKVLLEGINNSTSKDEFSDLPKKIDGYYSNSNSAEMSDENYQSTFQDIESFDNHEIFKNDYEFIQLLKEELIDFGLISNCQKIVEERISKNPSETKIWLNKIYINHFTDVKILSNLLRVISHLEEDKIFPVGQTMAIAGTVHSNHEIRDLALRCFEKWGSTKSLTILKMLTPYKEEWLEDYRLQLIKDLDEELEYGNIG